MNKLLSFAVLAVLSSLPAVRPQLSSYCGLPSCEGRTSITCTPQDNWGETCAQRYQYNMLNLRDVQQPILDLHNSMRNTVASGGVEGFPTAAKMGTVGWNVTLANIARINVRQCKSQFDECRNTPDNDFVGQNIGWSTYDVTKDKRTNAQVINDIQLWWWSQYVNGASSVGAYKGTTGSKRWNSAAQMMRDITTKMGCACTAFFWDAALTIRTILLTCNYDVGTFEGLPVYLEGAPVSGCLTGANPAYSSLCSPAEVYNANDPAANYE